MREAPSIAIINSLAADGAKIRAADTAAITEAKQRFAEIKNLISFFDDEYEAISGSDALVIITEWNQYCNLDFDRIKKMLVSHVLFDFRNIYKRADLEKKGFRYYAFGQ
jgi:UDPglucose 6-dehydrogenase